MTGNAKSETNKQIAQSVESIWQITPAVSHTHILRTLVEIHKFNEEKMQIKWSLKCENAIRWKWWNLWGGNCVLYLSIVCCFPTLIYALWKLSWAGFTASPLNHRTNILVEKNDSTKRNQHKYQCVRCRVGNWKNYIDYGIVRVRSTEHAHHTPLCLCLHTKY